MLLTDYQPITPSFTGSDISNAGLSTLIQAQGNPRVKSRGPTGETERPLNDRDVKSPKYVTINVELSTGAKVSIEETTIHDFLENENIAPHLSSITKIEILSPDFNRNEIQNYQEDLDLLLASFNEKGAWLSTAVVFGEPPQPYIHVKEFRKPEKVTFRGIMFATPPWR